MSNIPLRAGTLSRFCIESLKSANSVGNINTAEPQQKKKKECDSRRKGLLPLGTGSCKSSKRGIILGMGFSLGGRNYLGALTLRRYPVPN